MDKSQPFFDPYNFNMQMQQQPQADLPSLDNIANPMMYYEQQYMYYRYLSQVMDYKIKTKEYENLTNTTNNGK